MTLLDDLRAKRATARTAADEILTRSAETGEPLSAEDATAHARAVADATEAGDAIEAYLADQLAELRAAAAREPGGTAAPAGDVLTREESVTDWVRQRGASGFDQPASFGKWLRGMVTGSWDGAEHERAMSEGTATAGGHLVPAPLSSRVIDLARAQTRVLQAGAITVPMTSSTLKLARLTGEGTPGWKTENAAITANADLSFDSVTFTARTLTRVVTLSVELFEDAPTDNDVIANAFAAQMSVELDRAALRGSGTAPEPRGVLNQSGVTITTHGANGSLISPLGTGLGWDWQADAMAVIRNAGFEPNASIVAPRTVTSLAKLKEATTNAYAQQPSFALPLLATRSIPINLTVGTSTDTSEAYTAQWDQLMIGIRTDFNIKFLDQRYYADNLQYAFVAYLRADVQLSQPGAFVVDTGVRG